LLACWQQQAANAFDKGSLKRRLSTLRQSFNLLTPYAEEILFLYKLRNVMTHNDGYVDAKFCDKSGKLRIKWPTNIYRLRCRDTGKYLDDADVPKPFLGANYGQVQIDF